MCVFVHIFTSDALLHLPVKFIYEKYVPSFTSVTCTCTLCVYIDKKTPPCTFSKICGLLSQSVHVIKAVLSPTDWCFIGCPYPSLSRLPRVGGLVFLPRHDRAYTSHLHTFFAKNSRELFSHATCKQYYNMYMYIYVGGWVCTLPLLVIIHCTSTYSCTHSNYIYRIAGNIGGL